MKRPLTKKEAMIVGLLEGVAGIDFGDLTKVSVFVVDKEYGSLRSFDLKPEDVVESVAECLFDDVDGVPVCGILLVHGVKEFGELIFWKGDGSPILHIPDEKKFFYSFRKISQ